MNTDTVYASHVVKRLHAAPVNELGWGLNEKETQEDKKNQPRIYRKFN